MDDMCIKNTSHGFSTVKTEFDILKMGRISTFRGFERTWFEF